MLPPEQLFKHIPRKLSKWNYQDVEKWFSLNKIQTSNDFSFMQEFFDGAALLVVTPEYLMQRCGLTSRIIMKKIFEWLDYEKEDFEEYVEQHQNQPNGKQAQFDACQKEQQIAQGDIEPTQRPSKEKNSIQIHCLPTEKDNNDSPRNICGQNEKHWAGIKPIQVQKWKKKKKPLSQELISLQRLPSSKENSKKLSNCSQNSIPLGANFVKSAYELLQSIIQFKFDKKSQFLNNSGKIGRNIGNDIMIVEDSVSRKHAQIIKDRGEFYLKDSYSKYGTYVEVGSKTKGQLSEGDVICFQDNEYEILRYKFYRSSGTFDLKMRRLGERPSMINFFAKKEVIVGQEGRDICINQPKICSLHTKICCDSQGQLMIEEQEGRCFKRVKRDELCKLDENDTCVKFGLVIVEIRIIKTHKSIPSISEFFCPQ